MKCLDKAIIKDVENLSYKTHQLKQSKTIGAKTVTIFSADSAENLTEKTTKII